MSSLEHWSLEADMVAENVLHDEPVFHPSHHEVHKKNKMSHVTWIVILYLIVSLVFSAMSARGMALWFCTHNWNTFTLFIANLANNLLLGIPGFVNSIYSRKSRFVLSS